MNQISRSENFETVMTDLDKKINLFPKLESKYMGITFPFPKSNELKDKIYRNIKSLKECDENVCIAVTLNEMEKEAPDYKEIIFIGNDYLHLLKIIDFMKSKGIELSIENKFVLYREHTSDLNNNLSGVCTRITSLNDLFSNAEIQIESAEVGTGYKYEYQQTEKDITHYCCDKDDDEGKSLGAKLFLKSLQYYSKKLLAQGFSMGFPAVDYKIILIKANCNMCFYRYYYYIFGAQGSLNKAMNKAKWQLCEPVMEVELICTKSYFENSCFLREIENLDIMYEHETCLINFKSRITRIVDCIDEFYNNKEVFEFNMRLDSYVNVKDSIDFDGKFRIVCDIEELSD